MACGDAARAGNKARLFLQVGGRILWTRELTRGCLKQQAGDIEGAD
jgi:hypothetical protein